MPELVLHLIPEPDADPADAAVHAEAFAATLNGPKPIVVEVERPQVGLPEVLLVLEFANVVIELGEKAFTALSAYLKARRGKLNAIEIEIQGTRKRIDALTPREREELIAALAQP